MNEDVDEPVESQPAPDVWGADAAISISDLAASIPQRLAPAIDAAHQLGQRITPDAVGSAGHSYRIAEARLALANATNTLSQATNEFRRVSELLND
jgi:hypothetical protein